MNRPPTLRLFQAMAICIDQRDVNGLKQGLRILTDVADDNEGEQVLRILFKSLSPQDRFWFSSLNGIRKPNSDTGKIAILGVTSCGTNAS